MNEWRNLADGNLCNFQQSRPETRPGILTNCGTICGGVQGRQGQPEGFNKTPLGFAETLNAFAAYTQDNFGTSKSTIKYYRCKQTRLV